MHFMTAIHHMDPNCEGNEVGMASFSDIVDIRILFGHSCITLYTIL